MEFYCCFEDEPVVLGSSCTANVCSDCCSLGSEALQAHTPPEGAVGVVIFREIDVQPLEQRAVPVGTDQSEQTGLLGGGV